jgi:hypothetical protein
VWTGLAYKLWNNVWVTREESKQKMEKNGNRNDTYGRWMMGDGLDGRPHLHCSTEKARGDDHDPDL